MTAFSSADTSRRVLLRDAVWHVVLMLVLLSLAAFGLRLVLGLGPFYELKATLAFAAGATLLWPLLPAHAPRARLGAANRVTLLRGVLTVLVLAAIGETPTPALGWALVAMATGAALLDGVDGALARRHDQSSEFGARFDMETDALLILALALLGWRFGHAGAWLVSAGLLRYLFVLAGMALPWLRRPLPASRRRKVVCVVQTVTLIVCVAPWPGMPASAYIAGTGLLLLGWSFIIDTWWLARHAGPGS